MMVILISILVMVLIGLGDGLEKRQAPQNLFALQYRGLIENMEPKACFECPWIPGKDCCHFVPLGSVDPEKEERQCPPGLGWNQETCNCDWPSLIKPKGICEPLYTCNINVTTVNPGTTAVAPTCPPLFENECCIPETATWYSKINDTHYRVNGSYPQGCPEGMNFDDISCCCLGYTIVPDPCKLWSFDREAGNEFTDSIQQTFGQNVRSTISDGHLGTDKGVFFQNQERISIPYFAGAYFGKWFSLGLWVKSSSNNFGTVVLSNGNREVKETIALVMVGNSIAGGVATAKEDPPNTLDMPLTAMGDDGWHFVAMTYDDPILSVYIDNNPPLVFEQEGGGILSNFCQLNLGGVQFPNFSMDELCICEFTWNATDVAEFRDNKAVPKLY
ncbi:unnamed protein product, partial [Owenia fusiformis]